MDKKKQAEEFVKKIYTYLREVGQGDYVAKLEALRKKDIKKWSDMMNDINNQINQVNQAPKQPSQEPKSAKEDLKRNQIDALQGKVEDIKRGINKQIGEIKAEYKVFKKTLNKHLELEGTQKYYSLKKENEKKVKSKSIELGVAFHLGIEHAQDIISNYKNEIQKYENMGEAEKALIKQASSMDIDAKLIQLKEDYANALLLLQKQKKGFFKKAKMGLRALTMTPKKRKELIEINQFNNNIIKEIKGGI